MIEHRTGWGSPEFEAMQNRRRVVFGGLTTVATGLIAHHYGTRVARVFLAFPAIFPASATLVEKHERLKKGSRDLASSGGREAAAWDAAGAALGSIGLIALAVVVWWLLNSFSPIFVLAAATIVWLMVSGLAWRIRRGL